MSQTQLTPGMGAGEMTVTGVAKGFGLGPLHKQVLCDCSFTLEKGKLTVLIGPSGCGKSTLVNVLAGYEAPDAGSVLLDGKPVCEPGPDRLVVFQETALFPWMTTYENVSYGPRVQRKMPEAEFRQETMKLLDLVGLRDFKDKYPSQLSGGMQRRAELVRAMINQPKVMLMDEPFRGLDAMTRALMQEYYVRLFEEHRGTNLFVTSELEEAIFLADKLLILTNRPARVKKVIEVDLPRPREFAMLTSKAYQDCKMEALELLHEEAMKSFAAGAVNAADFLEACSQMGQDQAVPSCKEGAGGETRQ
ncbi:ABC transporter ATP-binding protein [Fundidesulfovibrio soli]|uniref:ABC transporter ATP-binding protein n=1 Tax=Fundidesulfovibrio soli TaxID=2922716 RepID=UPI001FAEC9A8|nr:ABC transporter ATP-binding protein [Fundidesulfovibrio soli]